ncbi:MULTISPECIES: hypothetical protein [Staphylococcus]|uniref:hypothetical protein n=1 Tax=Staphylococcus TaxID=1279 RepID=UPI0007640EB5|nr:MULTISPECIES: hypothetical protein [Staphylococcus]MDQ7111617.1 hypothetical protein [Staphylococcus simulans]MDQ7118777.1 hypothetical protein [Staphylococcus simulans]OFM20670.1 hypothetical protein HMPREF2713_00430 [Staphylococcus sp. HMSC059E03]OFN22036.1 hypothetical protein HMPREF2603_12455 [Staphylococcus sp. HMSC055C03]OFV07575.1 hypothetical protein HMPREF3124_03160 [Staphylococcus sp. HMSC12H08]
MVITLDSKTNQKIVSNVALEGMTLTREQQQLLLYAINNKEVITNELIRKIAYHGETNDN